jgi:hypothetical protein
VVFCASREEILSRLHADVTDTRAADGKTNALFVAPLSQLNLESGAPILRCARRSAATVPSEASGPAAGGAVASGARATAFARAAIASGDPHHFQTDVIRGLTLSRVGGREGQRRSGFHMEYKCRGDVQSIEGSDRCLQD